ncbi:MAG: carboxylase [Spirochaetae bacterium HGW-Spirochaetae-7]|nr:MAG: carboxylase [Spirochaetae bacterium HGW-Spirochaetae-7]
MSKRLLIRDLTLRDGQQSQFATRMTQAQVDRVLPYYRKAHFYAMEVWGGAVPDSVMRYLNESPWTRLESIRDGIAGSSKLTALSRGRNLFGYTPYPDSVIEGFCRNSVKSGIDIMRVFDALNDIDNMTSTIRFVKESGGTTDCAVCYTVDPKFTFGDRAKALLKGKKVPGMLFGIKYFVRKAKELAAAGADMITIKDMAGLIDPARSAELIKALKSEVGIPIDLHTHCTPGFGTASILMAMVGGVDIVDTAIMNFSGGPAAPAFEIIQMFADRLGIDTGVDKTAVGEINRELRGIRAELAKFDQYKRLPPEIDLADYQPSPELRSLFDGSVEAAVAGKTDEALRLCQAIEAAFNYPEPDAIVKRAQIPGGMYTNMMAQLKEYKLEQHLDEVLDIVPQVRLDAGVPPLVTPTSQIVGVQAVNCIVDKTQGKPFYTNVSKNFIELVKGSYGHTPFPIDPAFREKIAGVRDETPYDTSKYKKQDNPELADCGGQRLANNEKEELLLELFPSVADKFLHGCRKAEWEAMETIRIANLPPEPEETPLRYPAHFWEEELMLAIEG